MRIKIAHNRTLEEVQNDFNNVFPYLHIEFLQPDRQGNQRPSIKSKFFKPGTVMGEINKNLNDCYVEIPGSISVNEMENIFRNNFGLPIQILRKSGNIWLETSITGNWTLAQQNQHGKEISAHAAAQ